MNPAVGQTPPLVCMRATNALGTRAALSANWKSPPATMPRPRQHWLGRGLREKTPGYVISAGKYDYTAVSHTVAGSIHSLTPLS